MSDIENESVAVKGLLQPRLLGIDTYQEPVVYIHDKSPICRAEGFAAQSRVRVSNDGHVIVASLNMVSGDLLKLNEIGLSRRAAELLDLKGNELLHVTHAKPINSLSYLRAKIYGNALSDEAFCDIVKDIVTGRYADVHLAAFISACSGTHLSEEEATGLTRAMVLAGEKIDWHHEQVFDKHCVGGLPGNRTTPIVVAIAAANGIVMPKTSSRAITSPAGTADTMECLMPVNLDIAKLREVVEKEGACIAWGGAVNLSPADDILIRVERLLDIDSEGLLISSILSKKIAAGSTHVLIDFPVGPSAKIRSQVFAERLAQTLTRVGQQLGMTVQAVFSDGSEPVGRGIGPALEARDVVAVLQNDKEQQPEDLRNRALMLASKLLEMAGIENPEKVALDTLESGAAWRKFCAIAEAQGGLRTPPVAKYTKSIKTQISGRVCYINNRLLARVAKLAGAPVAKAAGIYMHCKLHQQVDLGQNLFTLHAQSPGELEYAMEFLQQHKDEIFIIQQADY